MLSLHIIPTFILEHVNILRTLTLGFLSIIFIGTSKRIQNSLLCSPIFSMISVLREKVFSSKLVHDDRDELFLFEFTQTNQNFGIRFPSASFWVQEFVILLLGTLFSSIIAIIVFKAIIPRPNSQASLLIGYGVVIPLWIYFPYVFIDAFEVKNVIFRLLISLYPCLCIFRTLEAIHGFVLSGADSTLKSYMIYYSSLGEVTIDPEDKQLVPIKSEEIVTQSKKFFGGMVFAALYSSCLYHYDFEPFSVDVEINSMNHGVRDLLSLGHLLNNLSVGALLQVFIIIFTIPFTLLINILFGVKVNDISKNALFEAKSPSDFWGKKWNLMAHGLLKRGVFKPLRTYFSSNVALVGTFLASGLTHDWLLSVVLHISDKDKDENGICQTCYKTDGHFKWTMFFGYCAFFVILEFSLCKKFSFFSKLGKALHPVVLSLLIASIGLPVFHWVMGDMVKMGFFHHLQMGYPVFVIS